MTGLTTQERIDIRLNLMDQGFQRVSPDIYESGKHLDKGDGAYTEEWSGPGNTHITLTWAPKNVSDPRYPQPKRLEHDVKFLGQADRFDVWHGVDDEGDEVIAVVDDDGGELFPKDMFDSGVWTKPMSQATQAAIRGAQMVCWVEG